MKYEVFYVDEVTDRSARMVIEADSIKDAINKAEALPYVYHVADVYELEV